MTQAGLPPGATSTTSVRLRGANVVDSYYSSVSLGHTNPSDGTHTLTTSNPSWIALEGPVEASNPDARGRVYRRDYLGGVGIDVRFRRPWTPASDPSATFGSPDVWAPNSDPAYPYVHSTALAYGWLTYWQDLFRNHVYRQIPDRIEMVFDQYRDTTFANCVCTGSDCNCDCTTNCDRFCYMGIDTNNDGVWNSSDVVCQPGWVTTGLIGSKNNTDDIPSDANGATTHSTIRFGVGMSDDFATGVDWGRLGEERQSAAHEYGHSVVACAAAPGTSCRDNGPENAMAAVRQTAGSNWRPFASWGHVEPGAVLLGKVLTGFRYDSNRIGVPFNANWTYDTYDSGDDDFGTPTQLHPGVANCGTTSCGNGYVCTPHPYHRDYVPFASPPSQAGFCTLDCTSSTTDGVGTDGVCPRGLFCNGTYCWPNGYEMHFLDNVGTRLVYTTDWQNGLGNVLTAISGRSGDGTRDFVLGADSDYQRLLFDPATRFEATRAVDAVYIGPNWVRGDDYPDRLTNGTPVALRGSNVVPLWWGNGAYEYPRFEDWLDAEVVLFRGVQGASYTVTGQFMDTSGSPVLEAWRLDGAYTYVATEWSSGTLTIGPLPSNAWYALYIWGGIGPMRWQGTLRRSAGDDLSADPAEALPMVSGMTETAVGSPSDLDAFQIWAPGGASLAIELAGIASATVLVYDPSGSYVTGGTVTPTNPFTVSNLASTGGWTWKVWPQSSGTFSTRGTLTCSGGPCSSVLPARDARNAWGDQYAGQFASETAVHDYRVTLPATEGVSTSITDAASGCALEIAMIPPIEHTNVRREGAETEVLRWRDGAAVSEQSGNTWGQGPGGYIRAITAGTYTFRVRQQPGTSCAWYRLQIARTQIPGAEMPAW
ncbi:MAG: hypothetical protein IPN17_07775 [Deltaproteobacteria bacterium]|nr:hypothetical protein [Deltaproteobacteria bacterium]